MTKFIMSVIDSGNSAGDGLVNEDTYGSNRYAAWVIDGATDVPETFQVEPISTSARWLADYVSGRLKERVETGATQQVFSDVATDIKSALNDIGMPIDALPPACSVGVVSVIDDSFCGSIVGDVYIYNIDNDSLLSDNRFDKRESSAVQATETIAEVKRQSQSDQGIARRRRGYISGENEQWVLANNPAVGRGVRTKLWHDSGTNLFILASDGFARIVNTYGIFGSWRELAEFVIQNSVDAAIDIMRSYEENSAPTGQHFKSRDDACAIVLRARKEDQC